jgi:hypothetical protein
MPLSDFDSKRCAEFNPNNEFQICQYYEPATNPLECGYCKKEGYSYRCIAHNGQIPLSHSTVQNFLSCHYLCYLANFRGIQTLDAAKSNALKGGILWDAVQQKHLGGIDRETGKPFDIPALIKKYEIEDKVVAKVRGLYRAFKMLEVQIDPGYDLQAKIDLKIEFDKVWGDGYPVEILLTGYYDRKYSDYFVEQKFSSKPDYYLDPYFIQSQIGTYFLADPSLNSCIMEVVRVPDLRSTGKNKDESPEEYGERVYQDAISRPSHYFIGWNPLTRRYGKKYFKKEFDIWDLKSRYIHIFREYWEARKFNGWYKNDKSCMNLLPGIPCEMLSVCRHGNMSESIYKIRQRPVIF